LTVRLSKVGEQEVSLHDEELATLRDGSGNEVTWGTT